MNKAVKRNIDRFPADFVFRLTVEEASALRFQSGISKVARRGGRRYLPFVFTEQGVVRLSSVLRSRRAVEVNIEIMRALVQLRPFLNPLNGLNGAKRLNDWNGWNGLEKKYDEQIQSILNAIRQLMAPPDPKKRKIGFLVEEKATAYGRK
jgi:hypothetical protein